MFLSTCRFCMGIPMTFFASDASAGAPTKKHFEARVNCTGCLGQHRTSHLQPQAQASDFHAKLVLPLADTVVPGDCCQLGGTGVHPPQGPSGVSY